MAHYKRWQKYGDPEGSAPVKPQARTLTPAGYVRIWVKGEGETFEHRHIMSQMIGRPLARDEQVHHLNGIRSDNRPENLELWSTRQPPGKRVHDLVKYAREILDRYGELSL